MCRSGIGIHSEHEAISWVLVHAPYSYLRFSINSLAFWVGCGTTRHALCDYYLSEQKKGFEYVTIKDDRAVIGYQIEFDETGQILRLKQRRNAGGDGGETNATLAVLAACLTCDMSVVNPPAVLQRQTAVALWQGITATQPVPPLGSRLWYAIMDLIFARRPPVPVISRWLTCGAAARFVLHVPQHSSSLPICDPGTSVISS
ncbi:unnamed protein product [Symbiodinium necroappetens]|uniref:Uncharacterized protein n=1 Tax=Symbiodinium necroappetens TaxID=1628268 RepID=A0A813C5B8_9DINO|nr:unnamed protein product [Symbiodinium necroappetens]